MRDLLYLIGEIILVIIAIPLILLGAALLGIVYFFYVICEFIKTFIFNK